MATDYKIKVQNVTKEYDLFKTQSEKLRSFFALNRKPIPHFWSLMGISLEVKAGETLGLMISQTATSQTTANDTSKKEHFSKDKSVVAEISEQDKSQHTNKIDHSNDDTVARMNAMLQHDAQDSVQLIVNHNNRGVSFTRNQGITASHGQYISFLDGDDLWTPDKLQVQADVITQQGAEWVFANYTVIDRSRTTAAFIIRITSFVFV